MIALMMPNSAEISRKSRPAPRGRDVPQERPSAVLVRSAQRQLRRSDRDACEAAVRNHQPRMLAVARRILRSEEDAQDAVQDALVSAMRGMGSFDGRAQLATWIHRIVVNSCLMKLRVRKRREAWSLDNSWQDPRGANGRTAEVAAGERSDAHAERTELRTAIHACIERLPKDYREIVLLRDIDELDTDETAARLGVSRAVVKTRLHRARAALRTLLEPVLQEPV